MFLFYFIKSFGFYRKSNFRQLRNHDNNDDNNNNNNNNDHENDDTFSSFSN